MSTPTINQATMDDLELALDYTGLDALLVDKRSKNSVAISAELAGFTALKKMLLQKSATTIMQGLNNIASRSTRTSSLGNDSILSQQVIRELGWPIGLRRLVWELNSGSFISYLQELTQVGALLPDPFLRKGGLLTDGGEGDFIHSQHNDRDRKLQCRVQLFLQLNPQWQTDWGGSPVLKKDLYSAQEQIVPLSGLDCGIIDVKKLPCYRFQKICSPPEQRYACLTLNYYGQSSK